MSGMGPRLDAKRRLFLRAHRQGGYFTAGQAVEVGFTHQAQAHHVAVGNWQRVDRGIFRLTDWVSEPLDDLARWDLWSRRRAVVSHESALAVHEIGEFESARVHLTVPRRFTMTDPALVLHTADLDTQDITEGGGFRVTTALRSIVDIAATGPDVDQLGRAVSEARTRGMFTNRMLRSRAEEIDTRAALYIERALSLYTGS
jgi:predicted transcriptional regulator of viral defense system